MSYSTDFRDLVIDKISSGMTWNDACNTFSISRGSISQWLKNMKDNGTSADPARKLYKSRKIDPELRVIPLKSYPPISQQASANHPGFRQFPSARCMKAPSVQKPSVSHALDSDLICQIWS